MKKSKLEKLKDSFDTEMMRLYDEYAKLNREFDGYRGKNFEETDVEKVKETFLAIQKKFTELYPAIFYLGARNQFSISVMHNHNSFIDQLTRAGFLVDPTKTSNIIMES